MRTTTCLGVEMLETRCNPSLLSLTPVTPLLAPITTPVAPLATTLAPVASLAAPAAITSLVSATTSTSLTQLTSTVTQTTAAVTSLIQSTPLGGTVTLLQQVTLSLGDVSVNLLGTSLNLGSIGVTLGGNGLVDVSLGDTSVQVGSLLGLNVDGASASVTGSGVSVVSGGAGAAVGGSGSSTGGVDANLPLGGGLDNLVQHLGAQFDPGGRLGNILPAIPGHAAQGVPTMQVFDIANAGTWKTSGSGAEENAGLAQTAAALVGEGESVDSIFGLHSFDDAEPFGSLRANFVPDQEAMVLGVGATANDGINLSVKEADLLEQVSLVQQTGVDSALQQLLTCLQRLATELALVLSEAGLLPWLLALLAAGAAVEIVRRDRQSAQNEQAAVPGVV